MKEISGSILLVDDEHLNLDMLSRRLRRSGFTVEVAMDGRQALDIVGRQVFDLILLDQMMPEISGSEVLRILRADFSAEALPIIMITAVAESNKIAEALEDGANDYITKPVDYPVALARIRSQLSRKHVEHALRQSEERYALAAKASKDGLWDWDLITEQVYFSCQWKEMLGLEDHEVENNVQAWFSRIFPADRDAVMAAVELHVQGQSDLLQCTYRMLNAEKRVRWMMCRGLVTRNHEGKPIRLAGSQSDITKEKTQDALTGLSNRLLLLDELECVFKEGCSLNGQVASSAMMFFSLDKFKTINESFGQLAGDYLLQSFAKRLQLVAGTYEKNLAFPMHLLTAYVGNDEFAILIKREATRRSVEEFAAYLQQAMKAPFDLQGQLVYCTLNIGIAMASTSYSSSEDVLRDAHIAMHAAKMQGTGEIVVFETKMHEATVQRLNLENDIHCAVDRGEFEVVYQPKVNLASGLIYGVEALLRWNHPTYGLLQPGRFISLAEETGAIVDIGKWVRHTACNQVRAWHSMFSMQPPLELSVNLSPREFKQENLIEEIGRTLTMTAFSSSSLHLEITEDVLLENTETARSTLIALKNLGLHLDIDDFGSGYSSLKYLGELPFDLLKIDRFFIKSLDTGKVSSGELIQTIIIMARNLGLEVVAEGIESKQHSLKLQELGCRLGQGFYFSKPVKPEAMQALLLIEQRVGTVTEPLLLPYVDTGTGFGSPWPA